jgi:hypothetical protein
MKEIHLKPSGGIRILLEGSECILKKPTLADIEMLQAFQSGEVKGNPITAQIGFLVGLGMPESMAKSLELDMLEALLNAIVPEKKAN